MVKQGDTDKTEMDNPVLFCRNILLFACKILLLPIMEYSEDLMGVLRDVFFFFFFHHILEDMIHLRFRYMGE